MSYVNYVNRMNQHGTQQEHEEHTDLALPDHGPERPRSATAMEHYGFSTRFRPPLVSSGSSSLCLFAVLDACHYVNTFLSLHYNRMSMTHG